MFNILLGPFSALMQYPPEYNEQIHFWIHNLIEGFS